MPAGQIIKVRRGTAAAWTSANPTLAAGEPGYETDTGKIKIGDGTTAWTSLAYRFTNALSITETGGPTVLTVGAIANGEYLSRSGSTIVGATPTPGGPPTGAAGGFLGGTYPNPTIGTWDGWVPTAVSLTYSSADSPTFVATTGSDLSGTIPVGARVKLTQTTVKYFIVTAIDATTITLYGGTDYTLANAAISAVSWSIMKVPAGFNANPTKWTVEVADTAQRTQASSTSTTWYNLGSVQIVIPIGCWLVQYECTVGFQRNTSAGVDLRASLSTANNSASDASMTSYSFMSAVTFFEGCLYRERILALAAKTTYYLVEAQFSTSTTPNTLFLEGSIATTLIRAVCAYL